MIIEKINATFIERGCCVYFFNPQKCMGCIFFYYKKIALE